LRSNETVRGGLERLSAALEAIAAAAPQEISCCDDRRHCELAIVPDRRLLFPIPPEINPSASCQNALICQDASSPLLPSFAQHTGVFRHAVDDDGHHALAR